MSIRVWILAASAVLLSSCATMSVEECQVADWRQIGLQDGSSGQNSQQLARHQKACQKANIVPNVSLYRLGYQEGLRSYCQPQSVFSLAMQGKGDIHACPAHQQALLYPYSQIPKDYLDAKQQVESLTDDLDRIDRRLRDKLTPKEHQSYRDQRRTALIRLRQAEAEYDHSAYRLRDFQRQHNVY